MDPQAIEEQSRAEQENYKVYKRRWLVLFAMFSVNLVVGLHKSLISIADVLEKQVDISEDQYDIVEQVSMLTTLISVIAMARALDHFGLRRVVSLAAFRTPLGKGSAADTNARSHQLQRSSARLTWRVSYLSAPTASKHYVSPMTSMSASLSGETGSPFCCYQRLLSASAGR